MVACQRNRPIRLFNSQSSFCETKPLPLGSSFHFEKGLVCSVCAIECGVGVLATPARVRSSVRNAMLVCMAAMLTGMSHSAYASEQSPGIPKSPVQQHYDEAFRLQDEGELERADAEHKAFLAALLHQIANARANLGIYSQAVPVYDEALGLMPNSIDLNLDYAAAALDGFDWGTRRRRWRPRLWSF